VIGIRALPGIVCVWSRLAHIVYAYFNNTAGEAAVKNARTLRTLLERES
jgi:uncharacterized protein YecE (DUF72 family)